MSPVASTMFYPSWFNHSFSSLHQGPIISAPTTSKRKPLDFTFIYFKFFYLTFSKILFKENQNLLFLICGRPMPNYSVRKLHVLCYFSKFQLFFIEPAFILLRHKNIYLNIISQIASKQEHKKSIFIDQPAWKGNMQIVVNQYKLSLKDDKVLP